MFPCRRYLRDRLSLGGLAKWRRRVATVPRRSTLTLVGAAVGAGKGDKGGGAEAAAAGKTPDSSRRRPARRNSMAHGFTARSATELANQAVPEAAAAGKTPPSGRRRPARRNSMAHAFHSLNAAEAAAREVDEEQGASTSTFMASHAVPEHQEADGEEEEGYDSASPKSTRGRGASGSLVRQAESV